MPSEHPQTPQAARLRPRDRNRPPCGPFGPLTRVQAAQNQWVTMGHAPRNHTRRACDPAASCGRHLARERRTRSAALVPRRSPGRGRRARRPHRRALRPHQRRHLGAAQPHPTVRREKRLGRLHVVRRVAGLAHRARAGRGPRARAGGARLGRPAEAERRDAPRQGLVLEDARGHAGGDAGDRGRPAERGAVGYRRPCREDRAGLAASRPPGGADRGPASARSTVAADVGGRERDGGGAGPSVARGGRGRPAGARSRLRPSPRQRCDGGRGRRARPRRRSGGAIAGAAASGRARGDCGVRVVGRTRPGNGRRPVSGGGARGRGGPDRSARRFRGSVGDDRVGISAARRRTRFRGLACGCMWIARTRRPSHARFRANSRGSMRSAKTRRPPHVRFRANLRDSMRSARTRRPLRRSRGNVGDGNARARARRRRPGSTRDGRSTGGLRRTGVPEPDTLPGTASGRVHPSRPPPNGAGRGRGHPHLGGDGAAAGLRRVDGRNAARPGRRGPRRRPPDADHLAGPAPGAEGPRPPVPVSGVPERPGRCSPL